MQAFVLPLTPGSKWQAFPALRRQVLQHLGRGILIGNTSSLTEVSAEKRTKAGWSNLAGSPWCLTANMPIHAERTPHFHLECRYFWSLVQLLILFSFNKNFLELSFFF